MTRDDDVITAAKAGDPDAWRELYRAHAGRLLVWLEHRSATDRHTCEDLASEAWLTAAGKIHDFRGTLDDFGGWLFGIARHLAANAQRAAARRRTVATDTAVLSAYDGGHVPSAEHTVAGDDWVRHALEQLSPREREVVAATEVVGLDVASAAAALDMTAVAVRVTRHRALRRLRRTLESEPVAATSS